MNRAMLLPSRAIPLSRFWGLKNFSRAENMIKKIVVTNQYSFFSSSMTNSDTIPSKVVPSAKQALKGCIFPGAYINCGGFGLGGLPETLLNELAKTDEAKNLTIASLTASVDDFGIGKLFAAGKVKRMISSYVGENQLFAEMYFNGQLEVELTPQGTIAQRMKAAGSGIPAFYTPAGAGTLYSEGGVPIKYSSDGKYVVISSPKKETRLFDGIEYVLEESLPADLAIVKAYKGDTKGNLVFRGTARNANPDCAMSGKVCIAEVEHIVEAGELDPDEIHLPGIYVDKVILAKDNEKRIERLRLSSASVPTVSGGREVMIKRAAKEFKDGMYVNLGIGKTNQKFN